MTAACLARDGHRVIGIDINPDKVNAITQGLSPIVEPRLGDIVARAVQAGRLRATMSPDDAIDRSDVALICVGTPDLGHGLPDLGALLNVAEAIIERARAVRTHPLTVVVRSTVLPGTTTRVFEQVMTDRASRPSMIRLAMNPEFMREGSSVEDFEHPPLIVVGCDDAETAHQLRQLYAAIDAPLVHTTIRTAEMVKYANNAFHALKVSFANEIAGLCDALEVDGHEVMAIVRQDRKLNIAPSYLKPGFAFGGSCLPKDLRALLHAGRVADVSIPMLNAVMTSNESQIRHGIERVLQTRARRVGVVGLAFKPGTDDLRESPMVAVVEALIGKGFDVRIYDSNIVPSRLT
ncbi:MAG TPA: nucleotide sugar dehydrogenase, partial [Vicinamibacterales bacterium]